MSYQFGKPYRIPEGHLNTNSRTYTKTIFGQRLQENPVPIWTAETSGKPVVILQDPKTGKRIGLNKEIFSYGFMTMAEPGGGKTNLLNIIVDKLIENQKDGEILIIYDTKGDYYRTFGNRIPKEDCLVFGAGSEYVDITCFYNIFGDIMPRGNDGKLVYVKESDEKAAMVAKKLLQNLQSKQQPIFPSMAQGIITACFIYFMRTYWRTHPDMLNNKALFEFIMESTDDELLAIFEQFYMKDRRKVKKYIEGKSSQTQGVQAYVGAALEEVLVGPFAEHNPAKEFSMSELVRFSGKKVIFIEYDLERGSVLEPIYGLMIDFALSTSLGGHHTERNNVYFILDEMLLLPELDSLGGGLNFGRSQGVKILCGLQNVSGLADVYGEIGAKKVLSSFQTMIAFHNSDADTRDFLVERFGKNYTITSVSVQQENLTIQREGHTVEDWDILALKLGEAIVGLKFEDPFLFSMPKYE